MLNGDHLGGGPEQWGWEEVLTVSELFLSSLGAWPVFHALSHISRIFPLSESEVGFQETMNLRAYLLACGLM